MPRGVGERAQGGAEAVAVEAGQETQDEGAEAL
jgi:hypothetical protein